MERTMIDEAETREARKTIRLDVELVAGLREAGTTLKFPIDVCDLSATGMRFKTSMTLKPGKRIFITFPNLSPIEATVTWLRGSTFGAHFERPLHAAVFDHIALRYRQR
jgi:hypothetical protein